MAAVQDPAFWKRFSVAVHQQDEEKAHMSDGRSMSTVSSTPQLKHTGSWLERNQRKQRRTRIFGWLIAFSFVIVIAAIVLVLLWFSKVGPFKDRL
ncbi:hypothetical protein PV04_02284 [Phialophora macrospora]|uniref:Uncharacterized protein n=1 Tax=Phialophora macrospora TaxID=1851006 RepID=A0A0D2E6N9_9EURO|nr:hypothetical protein PV04_02284 [Phialophora macrospora]